ncbi:MAG: SRPBCC family protein [Methyloligellaceae bacterium]
MAKGFEAKTLIEARPEAVWAVMTDFARAPEWMPGIEAVAAKDERPLEAGKVFAVTMSTKGRGKERDMTLSDWRPPHGFALSSREGGVTATYTYALAPADRGTRVTLHGACEAKGFWRLLHPLIVKMMARHDGRQVELLKTVVEGEQPTTA